MSWFSVALLSSWSLASSSLTRTALALAFLAAVVLRANMFVRISIWRSILIYRYGSGVCDERVLVSNGVGIWKLWSETRRAAPTEIDLSLMSVEFISTAHALIICFCNLVPLAVGSALVYEDIGVGHPSSFPLTGSLWESAVARPWGWVGFY